MTGTDLRETLHAVADTTDAPAPDRLAFERLVRRQRRVLLGGRVAVALSVAAAVAAAAATTVVPFLRETAVTDPPPATPSGAGAVELDAPVYVVVDGALTAIDPQGRVHDLGLPVEEVVGHTSELVYAVGTESQLVRFDTHKSDEGPGGWRFEQVDAGVTGSVQSAQLSADGRWIGWIDLEESLHTVDLKAGTEADPVDLPGSAYLADLAQGTGNALVAVGGELRLVTPDGQVAVPTVDGDDGRSATASRELVAVAGTDDVTRIYDVTGGKARLVDTVPGAGRLSPYGTYLASVATDERDVSSATLWSGDRQPVALRVPGSPREAGWADDDTVLVSTAVGRELVLYTCEAATPTNGCTRLAVPPAGTLTLSR